MLCVHKQELRFDVRLMQRVPYEGVSRMQTVRSFSSHVLLSMCVSPSLLRSHVNAEHQAPPP